LIAECAADLLARVQTIPVLANRSSITLGGKSQDPGLVKIPLPAAWVMFAGIIPDEAPFSATSHGGGGMVGAIEMMRANFRVALYTSYTTDADLLANGYPLIESLALAVKSAATGDPETGDVTAAPSGHRWRFAGAKMAIVYNDRLVYELTFTLDMPI